VLCLGYNTAKYIGFSIFIAYFRRKRVYSLSKKSDINSLYKPKIFDVLRTFSAEEFKEFGRFVRSEYFNRNKKAALLFEAIKDYYPLFTSTQLEKERLFIKISPKKFNDSTMRNMFSALIRLAGQFIAIEKLKTNTAVWNDNLLLGLMQRNLTSLTKIVLDKQEQELKSLNGVESGSFLNRYYHEINKYNFSILDGKVIKLKHVKAQLIKLRDSGVFITIHFIMELVSNQINLFLTTGKFNVSDMSDLTEKILQDFELEAAYKKLKNKTEYGFILALYIKLLRSFAHPENHKLFIDYRHCVDKYINRLGPDEISFHYSRIISYVTLKITQFPSNSQYLDELFELHEIIINNGYYLNSKVTYIPASLYRNIIQIALRSNQIGWLVKFMAKAPGLLAPQHSESMLNYGNALAAYETGKPDLALDTMHKISLDNFIYKYDLYNLRIKIFFDKGNYETLVDTIHAYMIFIKNDPLQTKRRKDENRNFAKYIKRLAEFREGTGKIDINFHRHKLDENELVANKPWLEEKYEEVINGRIAKAV